MNASWMNVAFLKVGDIVTQTFFFDYQSKFGRLIYRYLSNMQDGMGKTFSFNRREGQPMSTA